MRLGQGDVSDPNELAGRVRIPLDMLTASGYVLGEFIDYEHRSAREQFYCRTGTC